MTSSIYFYMSVFFSPLLLLIPSLLAGHFAIGPLLAISGGHPCSCFCLNLRSAKKKKMEW